MKKAIVIIGLLFALNAHSQERGDTMTIYDADGAIRWSEVAYKDGSVELINYPDTNSLQLQMRSDGSFEVGPLVNVSDVQGDYWISPQQPAAMPKRTNKYKKKIHYKQK